MCPAVSFHDCLKPTADGFVSRSDGWGRWWGSARSWGLMMTMNAEDRIRFLLRTAIRAEEVGEARMATLFRRMAEDMRTGEGARMPSGPVLGV